MSHKRLINQELFADYVGLRLAAKAVPFDLTQHANEPEMENMKNQSSKWRKNRLWKHFAIKSLPKDYFQLRFCVPFFFCYTLWAHWKMSERIERTHKDYIVKNFLLFHFRKRIFLLFSFLSLCPFTRLTTVQGLCDVLAFLWSRFFVSTFWPQNDDKNLLLGKFFFVILQQMLKKLI